MRSNRASLRDSRVRVDAFASYNIPELIARVDARTVLELTSKLDHFADQWYNSVSTIFPCFSVRICCQNI